MGWPDGLTVDSEGCIWSAIWDGGRVARYDPDGRVIAEFALPVARPTSCIFGGPALSTLYVTPACTDLPAGKLMRGPLVGGLFVIEPGTVGVAEALFSD